MREGWEVKKIGDVCDLMTGGTPSKSKKEYFDGGNIKWLVSGDVHKKEIWDCEGRITQQGLENSSAKYLPVNSVIMALNGQGKTRGTVALLRTKATCNQSLVSIYPKNPDQLLPEYIYANLHGRYEEIRKITGDSGNDRRGLNMPLIRNIDIPIASLPEQKRIVAMLDAAFEGIGQATRNAEKNLANARELFESYLNAVFTQKGEGWVEKRLDEVCMKIQDGAHRSPQKLYSEPGPKKYPYLTSKNIRTGFLKLDKVQYCDAAFHNDIYPRCNPELGDLLLTKDGANTGNVAINTLDKPFSLLSSVCLLKPDPEKLLPSFLFYFIQSKEGFEQITGQMTGAAIKRIILKTIKASNMPLPPLSSQERIVATLNQLSASTRSLEAIYQQKLAALSELKQSLLHKAFAGELTAEDAALKDEAAA
jgi:type I restriction enzyme S subunit